MTDRLAILAYVVWHTDSVQAERDLELKLAFSPGCVASYLSVAFAYEFKREAQLDKERRRRQAMSLYDRARQDRERHLQARNLI